MTTKQTATEPTAEGNDLPPEHPELEEEDEAFGEEFDAGWDDGAVASEPTSTPAQPDEDPTPPVASGDDGQPSGETRPEAGGGKEEQEPPASAEGAASESSEQEQQGQEEPPAADPRDAELEQLRQQLHNSQSEVGRLRGWVNERDQTIDQLRQNPPQAPTAEDPDAEAKIKRYEDEVDPEAAEYFRLKTGQTLDQAIKGSETALNERIAKLETDLAQARDMQERERGAAMLIEHFGGDHWMAEHASGRVTQWAQGQSPGVQAMLQSEDVRDAQAILDLYYRDNPDRVPQKEQPPAPEAPAATQPPETPEPPAQPDPKTQAKRTRQQRGAAPTPRSAGGTPPRSDAQWFTPDAEFDAGWDAGALRQAS